MSTLRNEIIDKVGVDRSPRTYYQEYVPVDISMCSANIKIRKAAYLPFGYGSGNHQPLVVDIDKTSVFGTAGAPSEKIKARCLKLNNPRIISKYTSLLHIFYLKHNMYKMVYLNNIPISY